MEPSKLAMEHYIIGQGIINLTAQIDDVIQLDDRRLLEPQLQQMKRLTLKITHQIDNVIQLDDRRLLEPQLQQTKRLTLKITHQIDNVIQLDDRRLLEPQLQQQRAPLKALNNWLEGMEDKVRWAEILICRLREPQKCLGLLGQISEWNTNVNKLGRDLVHLVETGIKSGEVVVERWLREDPKLRIIGVCGGAGVGKTTFLQNVYNTYKVSDFFDIVIWVTVAHSGVPEVQDCIAWTLNLDLPAHHSNDLDLAARTLKLSEYLKTKKFLLIFDNIWSPLDLNKLGVEFGDDKGSKIICSSRMINVIEDMGAKSILYIQPLTREEAWELFHSAAFKDGHLPEGLEHIARQLADECHGSPLAINVIAATMRGNTSVLEWSLALEQTPTDERFPSNEPFPSDERYSDEQLFEILRWSYERLPDANFKNCFMYCAMFPEDEEIEVDKLVGMWIAEGLVRCKNPTNLIETAHGYIKVLVDRCFFQVKRIPHGRDLLKTHSTLRDMAIFIGRKVNLFNAGRQVRTILGAPLIFDGSKVWERMSFYGSNIKNLPAKGLKYTNLVTLILGANKELEEVPMSFFDCLPSIRVLDLSRTKIKSLPRTLWQLRRLKYLDVSYTQIEYLSEHIGCLSELQFLNLSGCSKLKSLPKAIRHLSELQYLNASECSKVASIPSEIYEIKSLRCLRISQMTCNFKM